MSAERISSPGFSQEVSNHESIQNRILPFSLPLFNHRAFELFAWSQQICRQEGPPGRRRCAGGLCGDGWPSGGTRLSGLIVVWHGDDLRRRQRRFVSHHREVEGTARNASRAAVAEGRECPN